MHAGNLAGSAAAPRGPSVALKRGPLLALAVAAMAAGLLGGLARLGIAVPGAGSDLVGDAAVHHGPLMVVALFGTVIGLERAVAMGGPWPYLAPAASGIAGLLLIAGGSPGVAAGLAVAAGAILLLGGLLVLRRHPALHTAVLAGGCACWLVGNLLWTGGLPVAQAVPWWVGFLVLVIAGERLELSRVLKPPPGRALLFLTAGGLLLGGIVLSSWQPEAGLVPVGPGLLAMALWLARYDIARRTIRQTGLVRYVAACLLGGYLWLGIAGLLALGDASGAAFVRDAALHAVFLGFVVTMVFAHAPIILPALLRVPVPYTPVFYAHVALLHATLTLRTLADLMGWVEIRACAGLGNGAAILLFAALTATAALRGRRPPPAPSRQAVRISPPG